MTLAQRKASRIERLRGAQSAIERNPVLSPELQEALDAYRQGCTSKRTLAPKLGIGETKANDLLKQLERMGLIERRQS